MLAACGGSDTAPSVTQLHVLGVAPSSGTTTGGTAVTITGSNFQTGAAVSIGGAQATNVVVVNQSTITAMTPAHSGGTVVVTVAANGQSDSLRDAYTFVAPASGGNGPPVITSIVARGAGPREPPQYATLGETLNVSASVSDAETPASQLTFAWSADVGTFSGSGANVTWTAPQAAQTPRTVTLRLMLTERYQTTDGQGLLVTRENQTQGEVALRLHNSEQEVGDLAVQFLIDFSKQLDPAFVIRNFSSSCTGTQDELGDVEKDNRDNLVNSYTVGTPMVTVGFIGDGACPFRGKYGDACAQVPVEWHSTNRATGIAGIAKGLDQVAAVLENDQWRLCGSDFDASVATSAFRLWRHWTGGAR